jgi:hypothetical protein
VRDLDFTVVKRQLDLFQCVLSTPDETLTVMGYLKHAQEDWLVLDDVDVEWYNVAKQSIDTLLRHNVPQGKLVFLFHLKSRWLFAGVDNQIIPAIFLFSEDRRDGLAVSFYRILGGDSLTPEWNNELNSLFAGVVRFHDESKPPVLPTYQIPLAGFIHG